MWTHELLRGTEFNMRRFCGQDFDRIISNLERIENNMALLGLTPVKTVIGKTMAFRINTRVQEVAKGLKGLEATWDKNVVTIKFEDYDKFMAVIRRLRA
jgi:hypothetical protein